MLGGRLWVSSVFLKELAQKAWSCLSPACPAGETFSSRRGPGLSPFGGTGSHLEAGTFPSSFANLKVEKDKPLLAMLITSIF